jgi:phosphoadenosine phosphosulfate reductase
MSKGTQPASALPAMSDATSAAVGFMGWANQVFSRLNTRFEQDSAENLLAWAIENFGDGLTIGTSFGSSGIVMMDMAMRLQPDIDVFYIDTGFFFEETYRLIDRLQDHYQRNFRRVSTMLTIEEQAMQYGPRLYHRDPDLCCHLRKVEPLRTALQGRTAWATALRRDQARTRTQTPAVAWNDRYSVVKLSPLIHWTEAEIWEYIEDRGLPYNELHDRSFPSIGCWPCTRPVKEGEDLRAGRWAGTDKIECGLHVSR